MVRAMRLARHPPIRARLGAALIATLVSLAVPASAAPAPPATATGQAPDDPPYPAYWSHDSPPATLSAPTAPSEPPNAPPVVYIPGPPKPPKQKELSTTLIGLGSHYFGTPADRNEGAGIDAIFGVMYGNTRNMLVFSALDGPHPAFELALRYDLASKPKPFSFGAGFELGMIAQPVFSERTHGLEATRFTGDLLVNVFNASYRWKQFFFELRVISLGVYLEQPTPITARFAIESGLQILWLPDAKE